MDLNNVNIIGRLTKDPELKQAGKAEICNFTIAVNGYKKDEAYFIDCTAWNKTAELVCQYCQKGKQVCVSGSLVQERWEHEGQKRSKLKVNVSQVQFLGSSDNKNTKSEYEGFEDVDDSEDVPF